MDHSVAKNLRVCGIYSAGKYLVFCKKIVCGLLFKIFKSVKCCATLSACFPPGEFFFGANKKQANVIGWRRRQCLSPANQVAFFLCSREQIRRVENRLYVYMHRWHRTYLKYIYAGSFACDLHAGNFYFWILLPRRGIYFLGLCRYHLGGGLPMVNRKDWELQYREDITSPRGDTNPIFECCQYLKRYRQHEKIYNSYHQTTM